MKTLREKIEETLRQDVFDRTEVILLITEREIRDRFHTKDAWEVAEWVGQGGES